MKSVVIIEKRYIIDFAFQWYFNVAWLKDTPAAISMRDLRFVIG